MSRRRPTPARTLARRVLPVALLLAAGAVVAGVVAGAFDGPDERAAVERFAAAWRRGDEAAMHATLSSGAQERYPRRVFARILAREAATATATAFRPGEPVEAREHVWRLPVRVATKAFGAVRGDVRLAVVEEDGEARIDWRAHQAFPGVAQGERLRRTTEMPERADLLARDGTPLAAGPERTSELGAAAEAIVGAVGPVPPERRARAQELGYPDDAQVGLTGLERIFDERLAGRPGGELRAGVRLLARREPRRSAPVRTTIDPRVQEAAVASLAGRLGGAVALRPATGEVLAAAGVGYSGLQPPGSTFKIITLAGALQAGVAKPSDEFPVVTEATLSGVPLENANGESCGGSLANSFAHSCNSVFAPMGAELGAERLVDVAEAFGFNAPPGIPGAATSTIPPAEEIGDDLAVGSSAIGQGRVQASALQMAIVAAVIARDGRSVEPTLDLEAAREAGDRGGERVVGPAVARTVARYMERVVSDGTGGAAAIPGARVAGKTGTAELRATQRCEPDPEAEGGAEACAEGQEADPTDTTAWFAAFAPGGGREPQVAAALYVVGAGAGGETAAPAIKQVLQAALR